MSCKKWLLIAIVFLSAILTSNSSVFLAEKDSGQQSLDPRWKLYSLGIKGTKHYYDIKSITHVTQTPNLNSADFYTLGFQDFAIYGFQDILLLLGQGDDSRDLEAFFLVS